MIGLALLCLLTACHAEKNGQPLVISGKAKAGEKVSLLQNQNAMIKTVALDTADENGDFRLAYRIDKDGLFSVSTEKSRKNILLIARPGEEMEMDLSTEKVIFGKDAAERNRFMQDFHEQQKRWRKENPAPLTDVTAYQAGMNKQYEAFQAYMKNTKIPDLNIAGILATDVLVQHYSALLKYPFLYQVVTGNTVELPDEYYTFLKKVDLSSPYLENLGNTNSFLQEYFTAMESRGYLPTGKDDYLVKRASLIPGETVRENYLLNEIEKVELFGYNQYLGKQLEKLSPFMVTPKGKLKFEELSRKYSEMAEANKQFNAGQPAFDFAGKDVNGKEHRLSDYKGSVVVVDIWNTGCKPCIAEIPYMKKLENQFQGKDVVFISYSLDTDAGEWTRFLKTHNMEGNQWVNTEAFKSSFAKNYHVRFIPRFMVFDKAGNIVDVYAPRPYNPRLEQLIGELVQE